MFALSTDLVMSRQKCHLLILSLLQQVVNGVTGYRYSFHDIRDFHSGHRGHNSYVPYQPRIYPNWQHLSPPVVECYPYGYFYHQCPYWYQNYNPYWRAPIYNPFSNTGRKIVRPVQRTRIPPTKTTRIVPKKVVPTENTLIPVMDNLATTITGPQQQEVDLLSSVTVLPTTLIIDEKLEIIPQNTEEQVQEPELQLTDNTDVEEEEENSLDNQVSVILPSEGEPTSTTDDETNLINRTERDENLIDDKEESSDMTEEMKRLEETPEKATSSTPNDFVADLDNTRKETNEEVHEGSGETDEDLLTIQLTNSEEDTSNLNNALPSLTETAISENNEPNQADRDGNDNILDAKSYGIIV